MIFDKVLNYSGNPFTKDSFILLNTIYGLSANDKRK